MEALALTFVSSSQLMVNFTTQDLATAGSAGSVSVSNPDARWRRFALQEFSGQLAFIFRTDFPLIFR